MKEFAPDREEYIRIHEELEGKTNAELLKISLEREHLNPSVATMILIARLIDRVGKLEREVMVLNGQSAPKRNRKREYSYYDVELTDELLVEYIDGGAFTIYELEKKVGAKKNVLRGRYIRAKKRIQAEQRKK